MDVTIHTDGGSRGNPGPSAVGVVITSGTTSLASFGLYLGVGTNNNAEYRAVIAALEWLCSHQDGITKASFFLDSQLVVSQINGVFAVKHPEMRKLKNRVDVLRRSLPFPLAYSYVPRAQNAQADLLVNQALDAASLV